MNKEMIVVVPTLNPNLEIMEGFLENLQKKFTNIIVVNDGSKNDLDNFFEDLEKKNIIVLKHFINYGKGRSLKTAINYIYNNYDDFKTIITADSDGQHSVEDILKCGNESIKNENNIILGSRNFLKSNVPFKSKYGNILTSLVFKIFVGIKINDTQTGLRAFSKKIAYKFLNTNGERFDYETKVLIESKDLDIDITEVLIKTIYINDNSESHFNPLKDSLAIYKLFFKYFFAAISSFILDISLFTLLLNLDLPFKKYIILCTIIARVISSIYNYLLNKQLVFKKFTKKSFYKYYCLVFVQMIVSALSVDALYNIFKINEVHIKMIVDLLIFIINFYIQRDWVFKKK